MILLLNFGKKKLLDSLLIISSASPFQSYCSFYPFFLKQMRGDFCSLPLCISFYRFSFSIKRFFHKNLDFLFFIFFLYFFAVLCSVWFVSASYHGLVLVDTFFYVGYSNGKAYSIRQRHQIKSWSLICCRT